MMSYNNEQLDKKLDQLSLEHISPPLTFADTSRSSYPQNPKTSLLSSSLAQERQRTQVSRFKRNDKQASFTIDDGMDVDERSLRDEHPEPQLLATSVGKEIDGVLIPSSSTISLLSLSGGGNETEPSTNQTYNSNKVPSSKSFMNMSSLSGERKGAVHPIRPAIIHRNSKRMQPMLRYTSPPPAASGGTSSNGEYQISTSQGIPIKNVFTPDSPNLDPVSISGSPSRFFLSSQTPPRSLGSSWNRRSRTHMAPLLQNTNSSLINTNYTTSIKRGGDMSPVLDPVGTPSNDPPMTPLYLNGHESYFGDFPVDQEEENDSDEEKR